MDGGASYPQFAMVVLLRLAACSTSLLIGLTSRCFAHRARASCAPRHCHPLNQFPLKSYGFSGAETAKKRFLLWKMRFSVAKIAPSPPYTPPGTIVLRKDFRALALSFGFFDGQGALPRRAPWPATDRASSQEEQHAQRARGHRPQKRQQAQSHGPLFRA